jgi:hypothetical protein
MPDDVPALKPAMTPKEIACLKKHLAIVGSYVEFGCGGSTLLAVQSPVQRIWSVESDPAWLKRIRLHPDIAAAEATGRLTLIHADIGPTKAYGYPATPWWRFYQPGHRDQWASYYELVWTQPGAAEADLFFIDGRFRVASGLAVAAHCRPEARVLVHDFNGRPDYAALLDVFDQITQVRSLAVLSPKPGVTPDRISTLLSRFADQPH